MHTVNHQFRLAARPVGMLLQLFRGENLGKLVLKVE